jgi:protein-S-isoprenylcysteine O-methyltransferase Ste14
MRIVEALRAAAGMHLPFAAALLIPAGLTPGGGWIWPRAWIFLAVFGGLVTLGTVAMAAFRPASFRVRRQGLVARREQKQPWLDAVGSVIYVGFVLGWIAFIPVDVFTLKLLPPPSALAPDLGLAICAAGVIVGQLAVAQNQFAAPTIHDQSGDGQRVIDTGLYGLVRHPLYAGNLLVFGGMALWLGSTAALAGVAVMLAFTFARIGIEESYLRAHVAGYDAYAARVRGRLIPFLL